MRSLSLCTLLVAFSACGDNGGSSTETSLATATDTSSTTGTSEPDATSTGPTVTTGEPTTVTGGASESSDPTIGTSTTTDASTTTAAGTTTDASTTTDAGTTTDASTTDTTTGGAVSDLKIAVVDAELYADCQPEVEPDPAEGSWYVEFDNSLGAAATSAVLIKASLSLSDADPPVIEEIMATPTDSGPIPAGEQTSVLLTKLKGAAHSACDHCDEFYLLELDYQEGDVLHHVTEDVTISCSF